MSVCESVYPTCPSQAGCDTKNSEFSLTGCPYQG